VRRMSGFTPTPSPPEVLWRFVKFCFWTPIYNVQWKQVGVDVWLALAGIGLIVFPVKRWRGWLAFWMLLLMYPIFQKQMNVSFFFYPATIFLPLMTLGVAGTLDQAGRLVALWLGSKDKPLRAAWGGPAVAVLGVLGVISLNGSLGHFRTKIDRWTQRPESVCGAEAAMRIVNDNTTSEDVVIVPKQLYWLVEHAKKTMLSHCATYAGQTNDAWPVPIPREMFWFDADWRKAKYAVIASGISPDGRQQWGFDLVYTIGAGGAVTIVPEMLNEGWRVVYTDGRQVGTLAIPPDKKWPVAVSGEYIVLGNPRLLNAAPSPGIQE
jgi:hypothetical protein